MSGSTTLRYLLSFLLFIWFSTASSMESVEVGELSKKYDLNDHVEYIIDSVGASEAKSILTEREWLKHNKDTLAFGYSSDTYWFRFQVSNNSNNHASHLLEISYPVLDDIQIFVYDSHINLIEQFHLGDKMPFEQRIIKHRNFIVPITIPANENQTWLVRVQTSSAMQVPMAIWDEREFFIQDQTRIIGMGLYYGIMLIMILYNFLVFFSVKENSYLFYVFYVASMAGFLASLQGLNFQYIWPMATRWNDSSIIILLSGVVIFGSLFTRSFLALHKGHRQLYHLFGLVILLAIVIITFVNLVPYYILIKTLILLACLGIFIITYSGILRWREGFRAARFFTISWSFMLLGGVILALNKFNIIPRNNFTENAVQFGSAIEVILLSFALADRLNQEKRERYEAQILALNHEREARKAQHRTLEIQQKANETLEEKVRERTSELEQANKKLAELSTTDALTGVRNRRYFDQALEAEFNRAFRSGHSLSVLMLDIDFFKKVNDDYGHQAGDEALRSVSHVLQELVRRPTDIVARYGGEEFAIILPNTETEGAYAVAEKIREFVSKVQLKAADSVFSVTLSIGIMSNSISHENSGAEHWLKEADDALYCAKEQGRNRVVLSPACGNA